MSRKPGGLNPPGFIFSYLPVSMMGPAFEIPRDFSFFDYSPVSLVGTGNENFQEEKEEK